MDIIAFYNDGYPILIALALAVLAAVFMARAAVRRQMAAFAWGLWILAVFAVPYVFFLIYYAMYPYQGGGDVAGPILTVFLALANAILYWVGYAIFRLKDSPSTTSMNFDGD